MDIYLFTTGVKAVLESWGCSGELLEIGCNLSLPANKKLTSRYRVCCARVIVHKGLVQLLCRHMKCEDIR